MKRRILQAKFANDDYLWLTLCEYQGQYVIWMYNSQSKGYCGGTYCQTFWWGLKVFIDKVRNYPLLDMDQIEIVGKETWCSLCE